MFDFSKNGSLNSLNIVLDPGHGGTSCGCTCKYDGKIIKEEQLNYKIVLFMQQELNKYKTKNGENINVYVTRAKNENPSIQKRIDIGVEKKADIFISVHINASPSDSSEKYSGAMVLVPNSNFNNLKEKVVALANLILEELRKIGVITQKNDTIGNKAKNVNGLLFRLSDDGSTYPNGDTTDWYGIIRGGVKNYFSSLLIENSYLDNSLDYNNFLKSDEDLNKLAMANVMGIVKFYQLVIKD